MYLLSHVPCLLCYPTRKAESKGGPVVREAQNLIIYCPSSEYPPEMTFLVYAPLKCFRIGGLLETEELIVLALTNCPYI